MYQAATVKEALKKALRGIKVEIRVIKTTGDKILDVALSKIGDKGLFTKELEVELINKTIDIAVHSLKDLPTGLPEGCTLGGVLKRGDVEDALVHNDRKKFAELDESDVIATSSLRRKAQLLHFHPSLKIVDIRGNVNTRIQKMESGHCTGMIMAVAGLRRSGLDYMISEILAPEMFLPAVGQGAIAMEIRENDTEIGSIINQINHQPTFTATQAERAFLRTIEGGCQVPVGCYSKMENGLISLRGFVSDIEGRTIIQDQVTHDINEPEYTGKRLAQILIEKGAMQILKSIRDGL